MEPSVAHWQKGDEFGFNFIWHNWEIFLSNIAMICVERKIGQQVFTKIAVTFVRKTRNLECMMLSEYEHFKVSSLCKYIFGFV